MSSTASAPGWRRAQWGLVGTAFVLSGAAALVYQVVWQRILALHSGVGIYSVAIIVAAFMIGIGVGSHLGGVSSARVGRRQALLLFAGLELGIGAFAAVSCRLYYDWLYRHASGLYDSGWGMGLAHLLSLIVPTTLMGMSLPFLVRAAVHDVEHASRTIGVLYGINVVGAGLGALATPWLLIRFLGMEGAVLVGVGGNVLAGLAALAAGWKQGLGAEVEPPAAAPPPAAREGVEPPGRHPFGLCLTLYALSGFCALALEILGFRLIDVAVKSTAFTFGTILSVYLLGLGAGSLIGARLSSRFALPLRVFLDCQCLLLACSGAAVLLLARLPAAAPLYEWFVSYWAGYDGFALGVESNPGALLRLYVLLPVLLFGLPTVLMGLSFTALQRAVHDDPRASGRRVGYLQAANIAGCTAGSLLVGLLLLGRIGTTGSLRLLLLLGLVFAAVRARHYGLDRRLALWVGVLVGLLWALPGQGDLWLRLHGVAGGEDALLAEDATGVAALTSEGGGQWWVSVNGQGNSWIPFGGIHTLLGALPAIIHPAPEEAAVVGLGSGETAWAAGCRRETRAITVFEIIAPQPQLLRDLALRADPPRLEMFLRDGRFRIRTADGRTAIDRGEARFDLIQVDALRPTNAYSGNVYSLEFFQRCARKLKPGGLLCSQIPTRRTAVTFTEALPHVLDFGGIMVGGNDPIPVDVAAWTERLRSPAVEAYFGAETAEGILSRLKGVRLGVRNPRSRIGLNRDLFPRDEFSTPARRGR